MSKSDPVVFLLDDDAKFVAALSALLQSNGFVTRVFTCVDDYLKGDDPECPGCLVLDVRMPGVTGLELQNLLATRGSTRPIIFLSGHGDVRMSVQAMRAGAVTFLPKPPRRAELLTAIREAIDKDALERQRRRDYRELLKKLATLTPREREVLDLVIGGKLNKQIALELCTAEKTVKSHRGRIIKKLQVRSTSALIGLFARTGTTDRRPSPDAMQRLDSETDERTDPSAAESSLERAGPGSARL